MSVAPIIECIGFRTGWETELASFLHELDRCGETRLFHPHAFDLATLRELAEKPRLNVHCLLVEGGHVLGYGLLRGWDEGYAVPSLGIAIHPQVRARGLGTFMMDYLELIAARRSASAVRLRVYKENSPAIAVYTRRGYAWTQDPGDDALMVGLKSIASKAT